MTNRSVWPHDSFGEVESAMLRQHRLNGLRNELPIVRMDERHVFREARRRAVRIHAMDREQLRRPVLETGGVEDPASGVRKSLRLRQAELGLLALLNIEVD